MEFLMKWFSEYGITFNLIELLAFIVIGLIFSIHTFCKTEEKSKKEKLYEHLNDTAFDIKIFVTDLHRSSDINMIRHLFMLNRKLFRNRIENINVSDLISKKSIEYHNAIKKENLKTLKAFSEELALPTQSDINPLKNKIILEWYNIILLLENMKHSL